MNINGTTRIFGIIGNPVTHSLSPAMHNCAFQALGYNGVYIPLQNDSIASIVDAIRTLGCKGASVTIPHKETVMEYIDEIDPVARTIGAVNTLVFDDNTGSITGYNTDWVGSNKALETSTELNQSSALVIGAGGAAKAVAFGLVKAGVKVTIANRTEEKAVLLASELGCEAESLDELANVNAELLINTTSIGMAPDIDAIPVPTALLERYNTVMDIVYSPLQTRLLREAEIKGCKTVNGLAMLLYQGVEQFRLWTGLKPPVQVMHQALIDSLEPK